jgi:hypothetical protein
MLETDPLLSFNIFAANATYIDDTYGESPASPGAENYNNGFEPLQTLPATWYNSLLKKLTKQAQFTKTLCDSIYAELCSVIADGNVALDDASVVNLRTALHNLFDLQIAGALTLGGVLSSAAPNKVLVNADGTMTPNALADWTSEYGTVKTQIDNILGGSSGSIASLAAAIAAINQNIGDLTALTTTAKNSIVAAINEVDGDVGALANLSTDSKSNIVAAINEVDSHADTLNTKVTNLDVTSDAATNVAAGNTASAGSSTHAARSDHTHSISTASAKGIGSANSDYTLGSNSEGTSPALARADHTHRLELRLASSSVPGVTRTTDLDTILSIPLGSAYTPTASSIRDLIDCIGKHSQQIAPQGSSYVSLVTITLTTASERPSYQIFSVASAEYVGTTGYLLVWKGPGATTYSSRLIGLGTTSGCDIYYDFAPNNVLVIGSSDGTPISVADIALFGYSTIITNTSGSTSTSFASDTKICENYSLSLNLVAKDLIATTSSITSTSVTSAYAVGWSIQFPDPGSGSTAIWDLTVIPKLPGQSCKMRVIVNTSSLLIQGVATSYIMAPSDVRINYGVTDASRTVHIAFNGGELYADRRLIVHIERVCGASGAVTANTSGTLPDAGARGICCLGSEMEVTAHTLTLQ